MSDASNDVMKLARPEILALKAYESARSPLRLRSRRSWPPSILDANESPFWLSSGLNRYPEPQPKALVSRALLACASTASGHLKKVVIGRGISPDEAIDLLVRAFCRSGQNSILICPADLRGVYEIAAQIRRAPGVLRVPLDLTSVTSNKKPSIAASWYFGGSQRSRRLAAAPDAQRQNRLSLLSQQPSDRHRFLTPDGALSASARRPASAKPWSSSGRSLCRVQPRTAA